MLVEITLIRGGSSEGPEPDAPLSGPSADMLRTRAEQGLYPAVERVYTAPARRCVETAALIYRGQPAVLADMHPFDYGDFSGASYSNMMGTEAFRAWAEQETVEAFPGGVSPYAVLARNMRGFQVILRDMEDSGIRSAGVITHRAVIGGILNRYRFPLFTYPEAAVPPGGGRTFLMDTRGSDIKIKKSF